MAFLVMMSRSRPAASCLRAARRKVFDNVEANGACADDGDTFTLDIGKFRQVVDHAGNGKDFAVRGINVFPQALNGRQQRR